MIERKKKIFIIFILGFLVYFNTLFNNFVWDDEEQIVNNNLIHSVKNIPLFFTGSTFNSGGAGSMIGIYYKPLMTVFFSVLYNLFGPRPFFFHLFQISLHIINSILVFVLFDYFFNRINQLSNGRFLVGNQEKKERTRGSGMAFFLSLIFLVHPQNSEAVLYISALQDVLFFFFGMMALLLIIKIDDNPLFNKATFWPNNKIGRFLFSPKNCDFNRFSQTQRSTYRVNFIILYGLVGFFLLLSLLAKETGGVFILIIFLYFFLFNKKRIVSFFPFFLILVFFYFILRFVVGGVGLEKFGISPISHSSLLVRLFTVPKMILFYLKTFFYPKDLAILQHWVVDKASLVDFYLPLSLSFAFFLFLIMIFIFFLRPSSVDKLENGFNLQRRIFVFFFCWFLFSLGLHLNLFPLDMTVADRWFYLPMIGLLGLLSAIAPKLKIKNQKLKIIIGITMIGILSGRTFFRTFDWRNGLTLYKRDIKISKGAFDLENNFGVELFRSGKIDQAKIHFENSTKLAPYWWTNWNNLGVVYERKGDFKKAEEYYKKAIDNGDYYLAYENYGKILIKQKKYQQAREFLEKEALLKLPYNQKLRQLYQFLNFSDK